MPRNDNYDTPQYLADWAVGYARSLIFSNNKDFTLLEPGCGPGAPFACAGIKQGCKVLGVENRRVWEEPIPSPLVGIDGFTTDSFDHMLLQETDFLGPDFVGENKFDIIATNPPFSKALPFIYRSFELLQDYGVMIYLLKLPFLASKSRIPLFRDRPPQEVWVLQKRPSFSKDGNTDMAEYAFYVWFGEKRAEHVKRQNPDTLLKWLDNRKLQEG